MIFLRNIFLVLLVSLSLNQTEAKAGVVIGAVTGNVGTGLVIGLTAGVAGTVLVGVSGDEPLVTFVFSLYLIPTGILLEETSNKATSVDRIEDVLVQALPWLDNREVIRDAAQFMNKKSQEKCKKINEKNACILSLTEDELAQILAPVALTSDEVQEIRRILL